MSVFLGIDVGERRIGIASGDETTGVVEPIRTIRRTDPRRDAASIARICEERGAVAVVVGLPLHMDGSVSEQAQRTRDWAEHVGPLLGLPLTFRDERLTSESARLRMGRPPRGRSGGPPSASARRAWRARIDREAAAAIAQAEIDARIGTGSSVRPEAGA